MASNFIDLYKSSSNNLINALNEAIKLLGLKEELFQIDIEIIEGLKDSIHENSIKTAPLYKNQMDVLRILEQVVSSMNTSVEKSINDLISMLEQAFANPSLVYEITICQDQMDSIYDFISKEYLKEDIHIKSLEQTLLLFILKHNEKRTLPQYDKILNQLLELYNIASRPRNEAM